MKIRLLKPYCAFAKNQIWDCPHVIAPILIARGIAEKVIEEIKIVKKKRNK